MGILGKHKFVWRLNITLQPSCHKIFKFSDDATIPATDDGQLHNGKKIFVISPMETWDMLFPHQMFSSCSYIRIFHHHKTEHLSFVLNLTWLTSCPSFLLLTDPPTLFWSMYLFNSWPLYQYDLSSALTPGYWQHQFPLVDIKYP